MIRCSGLGGLAEHTVTANIRIPMARLRHTCIFHAPHKEIELNPVEH
jgi:hypothetical protein